ncbi:MAG TPA: DUF3299 domain-containing protein [Tepidisphaeraceae bacterium]
MMSFVGFFFIVFGALGYTIFSETINNGIHKRGGVAVVNLKALGRFPFDDQTGKMTDVPKDFRGLDGKKVALQGFMFTTNSASAQVSDCQLVWNVQKCCFGGPPLVQERIFLEAPADRKMYRYDMYTLVNVTGTLHVKLEKNSQGTVVSVYTMVTDEVSPQT